MVTGEPLGANLFAYCGNNPIANIDPTGHIAVVDDLIIAAGIILILGSAAELATITSQSQMTEYTAPSLNLGDLIIGMDIVLNPMAWPVYFAAEHTKRNGSKKKTNDKHTKPRPGRSSEKKKQKGWKSRNGKRPRNGLYIDGDWIYNNKDLNIWDYDNIPDGYYRCTNPLHDACIGYHKMIL